MRHPQMAIVCTLPSLAVGLLTQDIQKDKNRCVSQSRNGPNGGRLGSQLAVVKKKSVGLAITRARYLKICLLGLGPGYVPINTANRFPDRHLFRRQRKDWGKKPCPIGHLAHDVKAGIASGARKKTAARTIRSRSGFFAPG